MDLGLDITRTSGRAGKAVTAEHVRDLNLADLALLETEKGVKPPTLVRLRESHHTLARALASGQKPAEAAMCTGFSLSRISILQNDPAFKELLNVYSGHQLEVYAGLHQKMAAVAIDAVEELHTRLEDKPEDFSVGQLVEVSKTFADRTGHAPKADKGPMNVFNIQLADRLAMARQRAGLIEAAPLQPPTIEGEVESRAPSPEGLADG